MMEPTVRVFTGRLVLSVDDDFHEVELFSEDKKLKKGFGYIKGNFVYIYRGKLSKHDKKDLKPGIYSKDTGEYVFVEPTTENEKETYSVNNVIELNIDKIFDEISTKKDQFVDAEDIEVINNNAEIFVPKIKENDDFLKYIVKKAIIDKKINLKNYRHKFTNQYALNNMKSGLQKDTKMTVTNFKIWCEVLGLKWKMIVEDDGTDKISPLPESFEVSSEDF